MKLRSDSVSTLNNKAQLPVLGLGVWQIPDGAPVTEAVEWALAAGYRHIDTAKIYGNERGVGEGLRRSGIPREQVWITTKLWPMDFPHADRALATSLEKLQLEYVDLYLVHWPIPGLVSKIWKMMEGLQKHGGAKTIGVSNHSIQQLSTILDGASVPPAVNQVKFSPFGYNQELLDFCKPHNVIIEAYSPLTRGKQLQDPRLVSMGEKYGKTSAQILIRWALQKGTVVLPKSKTKQRIEENGAVFDFEISAEDMKALDALS